jgi:hypothetical protein
VFQARGRREEKTSGGIRGYPETPVEEPGAVFVNKKITVLLFSLRQLASLLSVILAATILKTVRADNFIKGTARAASVLVILFLAILFVLDLTPVIRKMLRKFRAGNTGETL